MESETSTQPLGSTNAVASKTSRKTTDTDLKSSIIEFMRVRPFLWNSRHPNYKDHKRREQEFQMFSDQIKCEVQKIKQVWHVLRTNFFRAHKLLMNKPQGSAENNSSEKLWKYYLAMEYILEGTSTSNDGDDDDDDNNDSTVNGQTVQPSKSSRISSLRNARVTDKELNDRGLTNNIKDYSCSGASSSSKKSSHNKLTNTSLNDSIMMEADDDNLYARSLTLTLKKFDPTTKEIIKLKFQEIIVNYMKQQQQQQQQDLTCIIPAASSAIKATTSITTPQSQSQSQQNQHDLKPPVITNTARDIT